MSRAGRYKLDWSKSTLPSTRSSAAHVFAALGDLTRLDMIARLSSDGPMSIAKLTHGTGVTRQAITKHLRLMERARLVSCKRQGRERVWTVNEGSVNEARRYLDRVSAQWDQALHRLKKTVEA